jgi:hypothetical protein
MASTKSLMSLLAGMHWDDQVKFAEAIETIKTAASMLSRPEVVACLAFLKETAHAAGSIQATMQNEVAADPPTFASSTDAVAATMLYEAVNVVPMQDAVKAVAVQDSVKAVAIQHAVKTIALREAAKSDTFSEEEIRAIVSDEAARAIALLRHSTSGNHFGNERRSQHDRRKHH